MRILNLGAGKIDLNNSIDPNDTIINVDRCYESGLSISEAESIFECSEPGLYFCKSNIFDFADSFKYRFDRVICHRIFEHMEYLAGEVGRLLEVINMLTVSKGTLEIVVPNSLLVAKKLQQLEKEMSGLIIPQKFMNELLIITSESTNIRNDPHLSTWTPKLARFYIESEGIFEVNSIEPKITFAGRDIYMRIQCEKKT